MNLRPDDEPEPADVVGEAQPAEAGAIETPEPQTEEMASWQAVSEDGVPEAPAEPAAVPETREEASDARADD